MSERWDDCCPHCEAKLTVYDVFVSRDYSTEFQMDCPECHKLIDVLVEAVPEFCLTKGVGNE